VAAAAGVSVSRVERFSGPVLREREAVLADVRAATVVRGRRGPSAVPLGDAVARLLPSVPGLRPDTVSWSAGREEDGSWVVSLSYLARGRTRTAAWRWDPSGRTVAALDSSAAALGHIDQQPKELPVAKGSGQRSGTGARATRTGVPRSGANRAAASGDSRPAKRAAAARRPEPDQQANNRRAGGAASRATVPSWDDIMFGAAPAAPAAPAEPAAPAAPAAPKAADSSNGVAPHPREEPPDEHRA
jgi:hypothetical protein